MDLGLLKWVFELVGLMQSVRVRTHLAFFASSRQQCYFINVVNRSLKRDVEITHVWIQGDEQIRIQNPDRNLPRRLKPEESWETWIPVDHLPKHLRNNAFELARVRLSNGKVLKSRKNKNVPESGTIAGN